MKMYREEQNGKKKKQRDGRTGRQDSSDKKVAAQGLYRGWLVTTSIDWTPITPVSTSLYSREDPLSRFPGR